MVELAERLIVASEANKLAAFLRRLLGGQDEAHINLIVR